MNGTFVSSFANGAWMNNALRRTSIHRQTTRARAAVSFAGSTSDRVRDRRACASLAAKWLALDDAGRLGSVGGHDDRQSEVSVQQTNRWSLEDLRHLRAAASAGTSVAVIAADLGRTTDAVRNVARARGISLPPASSRTRPGR